jgi:hypothetical protein
MGGKTQLMRTSESTKEITKALFTFRSTVAPIKKGTENLFFKKKYADLATILTDINEALNVSGLVVTQWPGVEGVTTRLAHVDSGEWMEEVTPIMVAKQNDPQAMGSAISYSRRYAITSILNLIVEDDDGNSASGKTPPPAKTPAKAPVKQNNDQPAKTTGQEQQANQPVAPAPAANGNPRPQPTAAQFKAISERIKKGEHGLVQKAKDAYDLTEDQVKMLDALTHPV